MRGSRLLLTILIVAVTAPAMALILQGGGIFIGSSAFDGAGVNSQAAVDSFISQTPQTSPIEIPGVNDATDPIVPENPSYLANTEQSLPDILYFLSDMNVSFADQLVSGSLPSGYISPLDATLVPEPAGLSFIGILLIAISRKRK